MSLLTSPRRRRRLLWVSIPAVLAAAVALVVVLLPSSGGKPTVASPPGNSLGAPPPNPGVDRAGRASAAATRPLADAFVDDVLHRRNLARAYALLAPDQRGKYVLADWEQGRDLPFSVGDPGAASASSILSFYGPKTVGFVAAIDAGNAAAPGEESTLVAIRFAKTDRWRIDYLRRGHSSAFISQATYAPHGFLPGSHEETFWTWSILILGFFGVIALVAVADRLLARGPKDPAHEAL